jgi:hypothetical protein
MEKRAADVVHGKLCRRPSSVPKTKKQTQTTRVEAPPRFFKKMREKEAERPESHGMPQKLKRPTAVDPIVVAKKIREALIAAQRHEKRIIAAFAKRRKGAQSTKEI